jgi:hypothetical protein
MDELRSRALSFGWQHSPNEARLARGPGASVASIPSRQRRRCARNPEKEGESASPSRVGLAFSFTAAQCAGNSIT